MSRNSTNAAHILHDPMLCCAVLRCWQVRALVLENTFTSVLDMAAIVMPFLSLLVSGRSFRPFNPLVRSQWRTADIIAKVCAWDRGHVRPPAVHSSLLLPARFAP